MAADEEKLSILFDSLYNKVSGRQAYLLNEKIIRRFSDILEQPGSFGHPFDSLVNVGKLTAPDSSFRFIQWSLPHRDGSFDYICFLQATDTSGMASRVFTLHDVSSNLVDAEDTIRTGGDWFGCFYYEIIPLKHHDQQVYTLLGQAAGRLLVNTRVIDVLSFDDKGNPDFGRKMFATRQGTPARMVFHYARQAGMLLKYDREEQSIVFDHLSPSRPDLEGRFEYYGPDSSYDGLRYEKNTWVLKEDLDLRNQ